MKVILENFKHAHQLGSGPLLATTITPNDPHRLQIFYHGLYSYNAASEIRSGIFSLKSDLHLSKAEAKAWVDVYIAYWKAIGELLETGHPHPSTSVSPNWPKAYEAWKEVANALIRGYSTAGFQAWTVPCLYVVGKYLRLFAMRADESEKGDGAGGGDVVKVKDGAVQDDVMGGWGERERLKDAARVINRMFTLCISDRYAESKSMFVPSV